MLLIQALWHANSLNLNLNNMVFRVPVRMGTGPLPYLPLFVKYPYFIMKTTGHVINTFYAKPSFCENLLYQENIVKKKTKL